MAQYGIAFFAIACLVYLVSQWFKEREQGDLSEVIQNNTKAMEQLTAFLHVSMARQETKIDELVAWVRRMGQGGD